MLGVYIHIPFCKHICHYCNFYKMVASDNLKEKVVDYIIREIENSSNLIKNADTIYIGGGTPSILGVKLLEKLFRTLLRAVEIKKVRELTIEANPEDLSEEFIKLISSFNINRISIGIQSFNKNTVDTLGRKPFVTRNEILDKINLLKKYNINNISLDLIYAVPGQTLEELKTDLESFLSLPITHISTYSFILEDKTILKYKYDLNEFELCSDELDSKMYNLIRDTLQDNGFIHYETSNFAKDGYKGLHNLNCWQNKEYIGFGPAAASYFRGMRYCNISNLNKYFESIETLNPSYDYFEPLTKEDMMNYEIILGLRLISGISIVDFKDKYNVDLFEAFPNAKKLINDGLLEFSDNRIFISSNYVYLANFVLRKLLND